MAHNLKWLTAFWGIFLTIILNPSLSAAASPSKGSRSSQTTRASSSPTPSKGALSAIELKAPASSTSLEQEAPFSPPKASASNSALPLLPVEVSMPPAPISSRPLVQNAPPTVESEDNVATLGMLDRTQQEILLLQSQIELDKLKQQLSQLSQPKLGNDYPSVSTMHPSKSKASEENIILIYSVNGKKRVRLQVNGRYPLDLEEGQSLSGGEKIISIGENDILLEDGQGHQRLLSMV